MISPPPSPTLSAVRSPSDKPHIENENPALSPKRSFAQHDEDHLSKLEVKRRHVHPDAQPPRRAPLDPLSVSDLENGRSRNLVHAVSSSSHQLLVTPSALPDLRLKPGLPVSSRSNGKPSSATPGASVCSWPPPISMPPTDGSSHGSHAGQRASPSGSLHSPEERNESRATLSEPTSTWCSLDSLEVQPTTAMAKTPRTIGWKSDNVLQPIRSRTSSMPSVRRPPGDLWRSDSESTATAHVIASAASSPTYSTPLTPPGLPPCRPALRRSDSDRNLISHRSVSLSLAPGTQPLLASEQMKSVPPIGAERSRVVSMIPLDSQPRSPKPTPAYTLDSNDPSPHPWCTSLISPRLQAKWKNFLPCSDGKSPEKPVESSTGHIKVSREDFERLLRQAARNKYATKVISPLSPLRTLSPAFSMTTDPMYQLRMPSLLNNPSPRYSKCPPRRTRTLCDNYQPLNFDVTCVHCQECRQDTVRKRLLAFRFRQQQFHVLRHANHAFPSRAMKPVLEDRIVLSGCERDAFVFGVDEEEKTLWDEIAAATSTGPLPFSRTGSICAVVNGRSTPATPRLKDLHDFDDGNDDYPEIPDEDFLTNESATLFREVSVC